MLVDASKLGVKMKEGKNQKTVLRKEEIERIQNVFINQLVEDDFSVKVTYDQVEGKNCSFSAGQYFDVKIEFVELTPEEFEAKMASFSANLDALFEEGYNLEKEIKNSLAQIKQH